MNNTLKLLAIALLAIAPCALAGCVTTQPGGSQEAIDELTVTAAVAAEVAVRLKCPTTEVGLIALAASRALFDTTKGLFLSPERVARVLAARAETNRVCNLAAPAAAPRPVAAPTV